MGKKKLELPENCLHKGFFWCKTPSQCIGCYYHPDKKIALIKKEKDEFKSVKYHWFYHDKKHVKICLEMLEDIKAGKGLFKNGTRCWFKHSRKGENNNE